MKRLKSFLCITLACILMFSTLAINAAPSIENEDTNLGYIHNLKCSVVANTVTVEGAAPAAGSVITFWIQQNAATPVDLLFYQYTTLANSNGAFKLKFTLNTDMFAANGDTATLKVGGLGLNTYKETINLYSQTDIDGCVADFEAVGTTMTLEQFFNTHGEMLGITSSYTPDQLEIIEKYHTANPVPPGATSDTVVEMIGTLGAKLAAHEALFEDILAKAQGTNADAFGALLTNADNIALLKEYFNTTDNPFDLTGVFLEKGLWTRMLTASGYATIESVKSAFETQKLAQIADEAVCVEYFRQIDNVTKTLEDFFSNPMFKEVLGITTTYDATQLEILKYYYDALAFTGSEGVSEVSAMITDIVSKMTRHQALVGYVDTYAKGTDAEEIKRVLTDTVNYGDIVDFITTQGILNELDMWERMLNPNGYATLEAIEAAFDEAYNAQFAEDKEHGAVVTDRGRNFLDRWTVKNVANLITIEGYLEGNEVANITYHVAGANGGITSLDASKTIMMTQKKSEKYKDPETNETVHTDSVLKNQFLLNTARIGVETTGILRISAPGTDIHQFYINLYPQTQIDAMVSAFSSITDIATLNTFVEDYKVILNTTGGYDANKLAVMLDLYSEDENTYPDDMSVASRFISLSEGTALAQNFIARINEAADSAQGGSAGLIQQVVDTTYASMGLSDVSEKYAYMLETTQDLSTRTDDAVVTLYDQLVDQSFVTVADLKKAFDDAYAIAVPPAGGGSGSGSGGSGGGGGGGGGATPNKPSDIGGGGKDENSAELGIADKFFVEDLTHEIAEEDKPVAPFKDVDSSYSWAKEAIDGLRQKSIIKGDGDGMFRPGSTMTREEYLAILLRTFGVTISGGEDVSFSDVDKNAWYADVVATAQKLGVTNGVGNNKFGIGQSIARADMVVLAARLAAAKNIVIPQSKAAVVFNDFTSIPDYAYEAVVTFQQAAFVSGDDKGNFNATNASTRAEAAVLFWNMYENIFA